MLFLGTTGPILIDEIEKYVRLINQTDNVHSLQISHIGMFIGCDDKKQNQQCNIYFQVAIDLLEMLLYIRRVHGTDEYYPVIFHY